MALFDKTTGGSAFPWTPESCALQEYIFDGTQVPTGATDTVRIIKIPAGCVLLGLRYQVVKAEGATLTFDLGDSSSATLFVSNANGNTTATAAGYVTPKYYAAADYVVLTTDNASTKAQIKVGVLLGKLA
jgi:hypothetical protein